MEGPTAVVHLRGHGSTPAELSYTRYSLPQWIGRIARYLVGWLLATATTLVFTFDPFVASFPFVIGFGYLVHTFRGRFHVHSFRGICPRCESDLTVKPGSKIPLPYSIVCYNCHHEAELRLATAA